MTLLGFIDLVDYIIRDLVEWCFAVLVFCRARGVDCGGCTLDSDLSKKNKANNRQSGEMAPSMHIEVKEGRKG